MFKTNLMNSTTSSMSFRDSFLTIEVQTVLLVHTLKGWPNYLSSRLLLFNFHARGQILYGLFSEVTLQFYSILFDVMLFLSFSIKYDILTTQSK